MPHYTNLSFKPYLRHIIQVSPSSHVYATLYNSLLQATSVYATLYKSLLRATCTPHYIHLSIKPRVRHIIQISPSSHVYATLYKSLLQAACTPHYTNLFFELFQCTPHLTNLFFKPRVRHIIQIYDKNKQIIRNYTFFSMSETIRL